jgi:hypothetical protein
LQPQGERYMTDGDLTVRASQSSAKVSKRQKNTIKQNNDENKK